MKYINPRIGAYFWISTLKQTGSPKVAGGPLVRLPRVLVNKELFIRRVPVNNLNLKIYKKYVDF